MKSSFLTPVFHYTLYYMVLRPGSINHKSCIYTNQTHVLLRSGFLWFRLKSTMAGTGTIPARKFTKAIDFWMTYWESLFYWSKALVCLSWRLEGIADRDHATDAKFFLRIYSNWEISLSRTILYLTGCEFVIETDKQLLLRVPIKVY